MSIEKAVLLNLVILGVLLVVMIWLLIRLRAEKRRKAQAAAADQGTVERTERKPFNWSGAARKLRPDKVLTGEMWVMALIAAFVALCAGVILVVFVFPLGAVWAASASFATVIVLVGLFLILLD